MGGEWEAQRSSNVKENLQETEVNQSPEKEDICLRRGGKLPSTLLGQSLSLRIKQTSDRLMEEYKFYFFVYMGVCKWKRKTQRCY